MPRPQPLPRWSRLAAVLTAVATALAVVAALACAPGSAAASPVDLSDRGWNWPVSGFRIVEPFVKPAHRYAPGHRGIDLEPTDPSTVVAPADGTIAFVGVVADRPLLTIDHGDGLVTTLEPVASALPPGTAVSRGDLVGEVGLGGHAPAGSLHFGVRLHGEYINPMLLLGGIPRAVLLPCCEDLPVP